MRLERLLSIVIALLNSDRITAPALARRFEVTVRTIYRDLDAINAAGIPIVAYPGNAGGFGIMGNYRLERRLLTLRDMASILTALKGIRTTLPSGEIETAIDKVGSLVPKEQRGVVELYGEQVVLDMSGWFFDRKRQEILRLLHQAVVSQRLVRFTYRNLRGVQASRTVEPMTLLFKGASWYLFGWCLLKSDYRLFHIGRMGGVEVLKRTFLRRSGSYREVLARNEKPGNAIDLVLRFPAEYRLKVEEFYSADQIRSEGKHLVVRTRLPYDEWVDAMILGYGDMVEVLEPESVRTRIAAMAARMRAIYQRDPSQT